MEVEAIKIATRSSADVEGIKPETFRLTHT
jgi:hypothetical protein